MTVPAGRCASGKPRRESCTVYVDSDEQAVVERAAFVTKVQRSRLPATEADRDIRMNEAIDRYLTEHLSQENGRAASTVRGYRAMHYKWFALKIGGKRCTTSMPSMPGTPRSRMTRSGRWLAARSRACSPVPARSTA